MKFPVNFISLEDELKPVSRYLKGRVLNAGCGERDISILLKSWGAYHIDNCDIQSSIPNAIICELSAIPQPDQTYDSILCNAVLEHVEDPEASMLEFNRLLKDQGYLVVSVPFLQPFHPTPMDFRRYTITGLEQLGKLTGFKLLTLNTVHSLAQTLGWIIWAYLEERNHKLGKIILWLPIYIASALIKRPSLNKNYTANSFQAVFFKDN